MHSEIYTDGVEEVTVGGSIVRVDLVSFSPTERDIHNAPKKVFSQRLIFSVEAFANSVEVMQQALQGLADAGVIKRKGMRAGVDGPTSNSIGDLKSDSHLNGPRSPNASTNFR